MKLKIALNLFLAVFCLLGKAQTNIRAWYAQGQVWIVWQAQQPFPETFAVYKKATSFSNVNQATVIGRLFHFEYLPGTYFQQTGDTTFRYRIPQPDGSYYKLGIGEALFVETITENGSAYYAVVEWGNNAVTPGENILTSPVVYTYDPINEPVTCHRQLTTTLLSGHKTNWYTLWLMGRQDLNAGRPDFPVMANAYKNGMPAMFIVSEALNLDTTGGKSVPATHWFHGGGGTAVQHTANKTPQFNIIPQKGISVSHTDDFPHILIHDGDTTFSSARSLWFGWAKTHNPFIPGFDPGVGDTIINYTQRRIRWINEWLITHYHVDPTRVALQGYSMGSGGASALGKAYPDVFSTVCAFNNGYRGAIDPTSEAIVGSITENLPTNLRGVNNQVVHINEVFDLTTRISPQRDFPLFRTWAGKNDENDRMYWAPDLVAQYRKADSMGLGTQISWDERPHIYDTLGFYWIQGTLAGQQTYRDNLSFQEFFRRDQSYPAFFNHRLDPDNNIPGSGQIGINNGDGDNWGTWGGYHNWDFTQIIDSSDRWSVIAWLEADALYARDNSPHDQLTADLAIRKPQQFKPATGTAIQWRVKDATSGNILQSGAATVKADSLVVIPQIVVYKENIRKVEIEIKTTATPVEPETNVFFAVTILPNPSGSDAILSVNSKRNTPAVINLITPEGRKISVNTRLVPGENRFSLFPFAELPAGIYLIQILTPEAKKTLRWVKL
ncbi:MAG: T9SS type A sorting domain-containing protein [Bacteroidia bacterium]|nr:T9SS type A sorting domain-containing protein [Bacteroidia bacterium]